MLKSFFLSQKKLLNAILRQSSTTWKNYSFYETEQFLQMQKTDFQEFELFLQKSHFSANSEKYFLELLRTPILCFSATKANMERCRGHNASKLLSQSEKLLNAILRAKLSYMKNYSF